MKIFDNGIIREMTPEEIAQREAEADAIAATPSDSDRIAALEEQNEMLTECILELSELLYA